MVSIYNSLLGFVYGDTFGLPFEFSERNSFHASELEGYGYWFVPLGTWSDDTSMMLLSADYITLEKDINDLKKDFCDWLFRGKMTFNDSPSFDVGVTINQIIHRWEHDSIDIKPYIDEFSNGNGALMRILPISIFSFNKENVEDIIFKHSELTHGHFRSSLSCLHYTYFVHNLLSGNDLLNSYCLANEKFFSFLNDKYPFEFQYFERLKNIHNLTLDEINSSGYVIDSLECCYWSLLNSDSFYDAIYKAVNLGGDTDTIGAITGGLAGLYYDELNTPSDWYSKIAKIEEIDTIIKRFENKINLF